MYNKLLMGSRQSAHVEGEEWSDGEWEQAQGKEKNFGRCRTLRSRRTGAMIDQYQLSWNSDQEYLFYLKSFNWRNRKRNLSPIVTSVFLKQICKGEACSGKRTANVYLEHADIPMGDALYMLLQAIEGYQQLYHHAGYFRVEQQQICIDRSGKVRVWVSADLSRNYPDSGCDGEFVRKDETNMVQQLFDIMNANSDPEEKPSLSLVQYLSRVRKREGHDIGFQFAKVIVLDYARSFQLQIHNRFQTILQLSKNQFPALQISTQPYLSSSLIHQSFPQLPGNIHQSIPIHQYQHQIPRQQHRLAPCQSMPNISMRPQTTYCYPSPPNYLMQSQPVRADVSPFMMNNHNNFSNPQVNVPIPEIDHQFDISADLSRRGRISQNTKSNIIGQQDTTQNQSIHFNDDQNDQKNTMKSMPMRGNSNTHRERPTISQRTRYSQCAQEIFSQNDFGRRPVNHDSFGLMQHPRRRMKESSSSYKIVSSNSSSKNQIFERASKKSSYRDREEHYQQKNSKKNSYKGREECYEERSSKKSSYKDREDSYDRQIKRSQIRESQIYKKKHTSYFVTMGQQWQLDPEIEADIRRYLG